MRRILLNLLERNSSLLEKRREEFFSSLILEKIVSHRDQIGLDDY
jgi:hypothetical protein